MGNIHRIQWFFKGESHEFILPANRYACGIVAYDAILEALRNKDYDRTGACATFLSYAASKRDIAEYIKLVWEAWPEVGLAAEYYGKLSAIFGQITAAEDNDVERIALFEEAKETEARALKELRALVRESADNRFNDVGLR